MSKTDEKKCPEILDAQPDENGSEDHDGGKRTPHRLGSGTVGVAVAPFLVGFDKGGETARLPLPSRSSIDEGGRGKSKSPYLDVEETADLLRTTVRAVYRLSERGVLPGARRFGRRLLVRRSDLIGSIEKSAKSKGSPLTVDPDGESDER
jgi:excisionase family DNA binding protein